jgi:Flp pilus assembly protein TadG
MIGGKARRRGWDEGATAVEAAIVLSVLIALLFGIIEFGTAIWQWNTMGLAVQQAGRWAMINNSDKSLASDTETQMQKVLPSASVCTLNGAVINPPAAGNICVYASTAAGAPSTISLTAMYAYNALGIIPGTLTVASQGTFPLD